MIVKLISVNEILWWKIINVKIIENKKSKVFLKKNENEILNLKIVM